MPAHSSKILGRGAGVQMQPVKLVFVETRKQGLWVGEEVDVPGAGEVGRKEAGMHTKTT